MPVPSYTQLKTVEAAYRQIVYFFIFIFVFVAQTVRSLSALGLMTRNTVYTDSVSGSADILTEDKCAALILYDAFYPCV